MKIGVVGGGVVGQATARSFLEHVEEVRVHDVVPQRATHSLEAVLECDLIFLCLPTPRLPGGKLECNVNYIHSFFAQLGPSNRNTNFVLRSTVPIGTTATMARTYGLKNMVHSPEFLTARCSTTDAQLPSRNLIGISGESRFGERACWDVLYGLYQSRFPGVPIYLMSSDESEAVKLCVNGFFAVKVAFWNEMRAMADAYGLRWDNVMRGVLSDGRIAHSHTKVPGPDGNYGFGGECLPKDLANLIDCISKVDSLHADVTSAALRRNEHDRNRRPQ